MKKASIRDVPLIEVYQTDGVQGFGCFLSPEGKITGPALIGLNVQDLVATVALKDVAPEELPYFVAETIMHEVMHVLEKWAETEFSEERIESLIAKYNEHYTRRKPRRKSRKTER